MCVCVDADYIQLVTLPRTPYSFAGVPSSLISAEEWKHFARQFDRLQGGWCCAPGRQQPRAAGFHLIKTD